MLNRMLNRTCVNSLVFHWFLPAIFSHVGRNKPVRAIARTGVSGEPLRVALMQFPRFTLVKTLLTTSATSSPGL